MAKRLTVGDKVIFRNIEKCDEFVDNPNLEGMVGTIVEDFKDSDQPYKVRFETYSHWWCREAEVIAVE